jgi:hypothetical protein
LQRCQFSLGALFNFPEHLQKVASSSAEAEVIKPSVSIVEISNIAETIFNNSKKKIGGDVRIRLNYLTKKYIDINR